MHRRAAKSELYGSVVLMLCPASEPRDRSPQKEPNLRPRRKEGPERSESSI